MIGSQLEHSGWRQGSVIRSADLDNLLGRQGISIDGEIVAIVASQSCDIANCNTDLDPVIEISIARKVNALNGNCTYNKNPRLLHLPAKELAVEDVSSDVFLELKAHEKYQINKNFFEACFPEEKLILLEQQVKVYSSWLAGRYERPALPTTFNTMIDSGKLKDKRKKKAKALNDYLSGLYVEITPNREIAEGETYSVNLLGVIASGVDIDISKVEALIAEYAQLLESAGIEVLAKVLPRSKCSLELMDRFTRFYYDDLSHRDGAALPD